MLDTRSEALYEASLERLRMHKRSIGRAFQGRLISIFFGMKFHQNSLPSIYSGSFLESSVMQSLLDDLYAKASRPASACVLMPFEGTYKARTGVIGKGNRSAGNTWRNNFNLQKGVCCYAPVADLANPTFVDEPRVACKHLVQVVAGSLNRAHCSLHPDGLYRQESPPKWLRASTDGNGYSVIDLARIASFIGTIARDNKRIPFWPFAIAIYYDADPGLVTGNRSSISPVEFMSDFNLSKQEFEAYFDAAESNEHNGALLNSPKQPAIRGVGHHVQPAQLTNRRKSVRPIPEVPNISPTPVAPPNLNSGWEAEYYVEAALREAGWDAHVVSRQALGYDVFAKKGRVKRYIEVKSSLGTCTPNLTSREWQQAMVHTDSYVLAVLENFNPTGMNNVYWVPDPANRCKATTQQTVSHVLSRNSWTAAAVLLTDL